MLFVDLIKKKIKNFKNKIKNFEKKRGVEMRSISECQYKIILERYKICLCELYVRIRANNEESRVTSRKFRPKSE